MTTNNALQLVQLGQLVDNVAESAYQGLQNLGQTLPALPDEERKRALLLHLHGTRQRLLRLHVLIEWSNKAAATKEVGKVLAKAQNHADSLRESADQLFYLNQELHASNVPVHDVHTARQVLQTGTYKSLPSVISDLCGPPKPNAADRKLALRYMDFLLRTKLLKEPLPTGLRISSIGSGHVSVNFPGYYTAVLTLAEAPAVPADQVSQPGQNAAQTGHLRSASGLPSDPQQHPAAGDVRTDAQTQEAPHQEKQRWRLLSFELLPFFEREVLTAEQRSGLQTELEFQMWQAADLRAQHSLAAAQRAQQAQRGADTAQSRPAETTPEPSQQPVSARIESSARDDSSSQHLSYDHGSASHAPSAGQDPRGAPHPLQVLHNALVGIAGKLVLHEVHGRLRQMLDDKGRWARLLKLNAAAVLSNGIRCSYWLDIQTSQTPTAKLQEEEGGTGGKPPRPTPHRPGALSGPSPAPALEFGLEPDGAVVVIPVPLLPGHSRLELNPAALNVQDLLLWAASQNAAIQLEALHHALQQQTSLAISGCTLEVTANPKANWPNLANPLATRPSPCLPDGEPNYERAAAPAAPKSPSLVMSSRGASLLLISIQLKTGYLRINSGGALAEDKETTQLLKQAEDKLASLQREMRLAPLEDPTLPRAQALSQALAKQLSLLFFAILQKACSAQLAVAAQHYGLFMRRLPEGLLSGFLDQNPAGPTLDPARCTALALPPTPLLRIPPHPDFYRPWVNLGQTVSQPPTESLAPTYRANPLSDMNGSASQPQSEPSRSARCSAPLSRDQARGHKGQQTVQPLQTRFSAQSAAQQGTSMGLSPDSPAALRFYLLAEHKQTESSADWQCYLLTCSCTFRGVLQKVLSCAPVPASSPRTMPGLVPPQPQASRAEAGPDLGGVISWCHQQMTQRHLMAELKVLGIPYTEELSLRPRDLTPLDPSPQPPPPSALPPNKRPKLSHESGTDIGTGASAYDSDMLDQQQKGVQARLGKEGEQASVSRVIGVHSASLLRHVSGVSESGVITIHIPNTHPAPGVWTANAHIPNLAELPCQLYTSIAFSQSASQSTSQSASTAAANSWWVHSNLPATSHSASLPASAAAAKAQSVSLPAAAAAATAQSAFLQPSAAAATAASQSPAAAAAINHAGHAGQHVSRHQHGIQVQSNLLLGGSVTALLELIIGIGHMQDGLRRMCQLMQSQQQRLRQMLKHHHGKGLPHSLPVVKSEADAMPHHWQPGTADNVVPALKSEEQQIVSSQSGLVDGQVAGAVPIKSEGVDMSQSTQAPSSGRRRSAQTLAWHVVSSGVVQFAHVGLDYAVLEVRPPPPWPRSSPSQSVQPKAEEGGILSNDLDMADAQQTSARSYQPPEHPPHSRLPTADLPSTPSVPFLSIHMQWKLAAGHSLDQDIQPELGPRASPTSTALKTPSQGQHLSQGQPSSQGMPELQRRALSQGLFLPQDLFQSQRLPPVHPHSVVKAKHANDAAKSDKQGIFNGIPKGIPKLRCCIQSEPELPLQVLESFQDMADLKEEGLLLDALAVVAQPLAAVVGTVSLEGCRAAGISLDQLTLRIDRPPYQLQLQLHQDSKPTVVLSLRFMKGSTTFIGLSALPLAPPQQTEGASKAASTAASTAAVLSQKAGLPERLQSALSQEGVFLPKGVSTEFACSPSFFAQAHQNRVSAGLWVRNSKLSVVLKHLLAPPLSSIHST